MESYYIGGGPNLRIAVGIITLTILLLASGVSTVTAEITVTPEIIPNDLVIDAPPKAMAGDTIWINVTAGGNVIDNVSIMFDTTDIGNTDKHGSLTYTLPKNLNGIHNITATKMDYAKAVKSIEIVSGKTWTVNASGNADYTRIQDAIDNASAGDTILVYSATYYENVNVTKQLILKGIDTGRESLLLMLIKAAVQ